MLCAYRYLHDLLERLIEALGTKRQLMHLMAHQDNEVRFSALNSVQKYLANLWYTSWVHYALLIMIGQTNPLYYIIHGSIK